MYKSAYPGGLKLPELGKLDRAIYLVVITVTLLGAVGGGLAFLPLIMRHHFTDPAVAGVENSFSVFGLLLFVLLMGLVIHALIQGLTRKYPIFGAPGVAYGGPEWTPVYPLVMPTGDAPEQVRQDVKQGRQMVLYLLAGVILAAFIFATSLLSGDILYEDGSMRVLCGPGWEVAQYQPDQVEEVTVAISQSSARTLGRIWRMELRYKMDDDRIYTFFVTDEAFREGPERSQVELLMKILNRYPDAEIFVSNWDRLDNLIHDQQYSESDRQLLMELFGVE